MSDKNLYKIPEEMKADAIRHRYIVNSVGDANYICINRIKQYSDLNDKMNHNVVSKMSYLDKQKSYLIDIGCSCKKYFNNDLITMAYNGDEFLLSHYHSDHYNGLELIEDQKLSLEKVYYPYIPRIYGGDNLQNQVLKYCNFANLFDLVDFKGMGMELISCIKKKNLYDFTYTPVYAGMTIFDNEYKVIWPQPTSYCTEALAKGIAKIENELSKDEKIHMMWENFNRIAEFDDKQVLKTTEKAITIFNNANIDFEEYKIIIDSLKDAIRKVTNRFSVCLFKEDEFLFLGDLEKEEIKHCLERLKRDLGEVIQVDYLITPHHGTQSHYWKDIGKYVKPKYVISSNGDQRYRRYDEQYNDLASEMAYCTHIQDTFDSEKLRKSYFVL